MQNYIKLITQQLQRDENISPYISVIMIFLFYYHLRDLLCIVVIYICMQLMWF